MQFTDRVCLSSVCPFAPTIDFLHPIRARWPPQPKRWSYVSCVFQFDLLHSYWLHKDQNLPLNLYSNAHKLQGKRDFVRLIDSAFTWKDSYIFQRTGARSEFLNFTPHTSK